SGWAAMAGSAAAARLRAKTVLRMGFLSNGCVRRATAVVRQSLAAADSLEGLVRCARSKAEGAWAGQMSPVPGLHASASARPRGGVTFRQPRRRRELRIRIGLHAARLHEAQGHAVAFADRAVLLRV